MVSALHVSTKLLYIELG